MSAGGGGGGAGSVSAGARARAAVGEKPRPAVSGYRWVYLWHWPIRAMHWLAFASIAVLVVTGFYIGRPYFMTGTGDATSYAMGWMRFLHFAAAGVFVATAIIRIYWLFAGNKFERVRALFPLRGRDIGNLWRMVKKYLMIRPEKAPHYLGHNPLQQLSYTLVYVVGAFMVVTGFALYGLSNPGGFFYGAFGWVRELLGGAQGVRFWHHVVTWFFIVFFPIHVYLAIRADVTELDGSLSSIVSGGKFVREDLEFEDE